MIVRFNRIRWNAIVGWIILKKKSLIGTESLWQNVHLNFWTFESCQLQHVWFNTNIMICKKSNEIAVLNARRSELMLHVISILYLIIFEWKLVLDNQYYHHHHHSLRNQKYSSFNISIVPPIHHPLFTL